MWTVKTTVLNENVHKLNIFENESPLTYENAVRYWQENSDFRNLYFSILEKSPFEAFFWEHPPVTRGNIQKIYEFVLVNSPQLAKVAADWKPFEEKFKVHSSSQSVIAFENLGRDAELIVPSPTNPTSDYAHFASFLHHAPESQKHDLFVRLADSLSRRINDKPTWVSTSGLGVYWLHIRLDTKPKYYSYQPYRTNIER